MSKIFNGSFSKMFNKIKPYAITAVVLVVTLGAIKMFAPESIKSHIRI